MRIRSGRKVRVTYLNIITELCPGVDVCDTGMNMKLDRLAFVDKDLLQQRSVGFARVHVRVRDEEPVRPILHFPAGTQPFFFRGSEVDQHKPDARYLPYQPSA